MTKSIIEQHMDEAGRQMAREIDREIMWGMLKEIGWTRVNLPNYFKNAEHAVDLMGWIEHNIKGAYEKAGADFIFEDEKDASMFILKWV